MANPSSKSSDEDKHSCAGEVGSELKALGQTARPTEPYEMPCLGTLQGVNKAASKVSALSILSRSAAYKSLHEKALKLQEINNENDENENKNTVNKIDHGKAVETHTSHGGDPGERYGVAFGTSSGLPLQRNMFPLTPFLTAPLLSSYNTVDPLGDPIHWTSLASVLPTGLSRAAEVSIIQYPFLGEK